MRTLESVSAQRAAWMGCFTLCFEEVAPANYGKAIAN
jgi:hypothetical protein